MQAINIRRLGVLAAAVLLAAGIGSAARAADVHPGQAVYERSCAACHNAPEPGSRAAPVTSLRQMDARTLRASLTTGVMKGIGDSLSPDDLRAVVDYLAVKPKPVSDDWIEGARCPADRRSIDVTAPLPSGSFGISADNRRRLTAAQSGLTTASLARLQPAWTLAIPNATTMRSQPVLLGSTSTPGRAASSGRPSPRPASAPAWPSAGSARAGRWPWWAATRAVISRPGRRRPASCSGGPIPATTRAVS